MQGKKPVVSPEQFNSIPLVKLCTLINFKSTVFQENAQDFTPSPKPYSTILGNTTTFTRRYLLLLQHISRDLHEILARKHVCFSPHISNGLLRDTIPF